MLIEIQRKKRVKPTVFLEEAGISITVEESGVSWFSASTIPALYSEEVMYSGGIRGVTRELLSTLAETPEKAIYDLLFKAEGCTFVDQMKYDITFPFFESFVVNKEGSFLEVVDK